MKDHIGIVVNNKKINELYNVISVQIENANLGTPGQFYELKVKYSQRMRIPISIYNITDNVVEFMVKIVGDGTKELTQLKEKDTIMALGPLGNPFTPPQADQNCLILSGGVGYAPFYYFKKHYPKANITWFHGGANRNEVFEADRIFTNDGSIGIKGFVTADLHEYLQSNKVDRILTCGPRIMMKNIANIALPFVKDIECSLEEYMACGIGVCYGCAVKVKTAKGLVYKTVCKDGAIFQGSEVIWDE